MLTLLAEAAIVSLASWQQQQQQQHGATALRKKNAKSFLEFMLAVRAVSVGFTLITVAKTMTSVAATTSSDPRELRASASRDARGGSPQQRLQKLLTVPGYDSSRVNDLLLLRPDSDDSEPKEKSSNKHVVFFHGDIQVSEGVLWGGSQVIPMPIKGR